MQLLKENWSSPLCTTINHMHIRQGYNRHHQLSGLALASKRQYRILDVVLPFEGFINAYVKNERWSAEDLRNRPRTGFLPLRNNEYLPLRAQLNAQA